VRGGYHYGLKTLFVYLRQSMFEEITDPNTLDYFLYRRSKTIHHELAHYVDHVRGSISKERYIKPDESIKRYMKQRTEIYAEVIAAFLRIKQLTKINFLYKEMSDDDIVNAYHKIKEGVPLNKIDEFDVPAIKSPQFFLRTLLALLNKQREEMAGGSKEYKLDTNEKKKLSRKILPLYDDFLDFVKKEFLDMVDMLIDNPQSNE
jgi:hypothetical protein